MSWVPPYLAQTQTEIGAFFNEQHVMPSLVVREEVVLHRQDTVRLWLTAQRRSHLGPPVQTR